MNGVFIYVLKAIFKVFLCMEDVHSNVLQCSDEPDTIELILKWIWFLWVFQWPLCLKFSSESSSCLFHVTELFKLWNSCPGILDHYRPGFDWLICKPRLVTMDAWEILRRQVSDLLIQKLNLKAEKFWILVLLIQMVQLFILPILKILRSL